MFEPIIESLLDPKEINPENRLDKLMVVLTILKDSGMNKSDMNDDTSLSIAGKLYSPTLFKESDEILTEILLEDIKLATEIALVDKPNTLELIEGSSEDVEDLIDVDIDELPDKVVNVEFDKAMGRVE